MADRDSPANPTAEAEPEISESRMRLTAIIIAVALFMQNLDSTVVSTALPAMARSFKAEPVYMSVAITSYLISLSVFIPASGWVADHFGARRVFRAAIVIFTLGSLFCGLSPSLPALVGARVLQGLGGAMMLPVGRLLLLNSVSRAQMVAAMSWLTMPALLGPIMGPPLGGFILSVTSWRWVFNINIPIGVIGVIAVTRYIPEIRVEGRGGRLDVPGILLSGLGMALIMIGLETAGRGLVPVSWTIGAFLGGSAAWLCYGLYARRASNPVLDFSLMRVPTFAISLLAGSLFRIPVGAIPFLLPLMLQLGFGKTPLQSGFITFTAGLGALLMKLAAKPALAQFGFRSVLMWNGLAAVLTMALTAAFAPSWPTWLMEAVLFVSGFFRSLQFTAFNTIAYGDIPRARMSAATTLYSTIQQLTLTLGVVVGAAALELLAWAGGHVSPTQRDYSGAFLIVSIMALGSIPFCAKLARNAGAALSGHH